VTLVADADLNTAYAQLAGKDQTGRFIMFCYQCEQTSKGEGCQTLGVCGKDETTAALQDLLLHAVKGISIYAHRARTLGAADAEIDAFTIAQVF
jgi:hydroxylamine reductase